MSQGQTFNDIKSLSYLIAKKNVVFGPANTDNYPFQNYSTNPPQSNGDGVDVSQYVQTRNGVLLRRNGDKRFCFVKMLTDNDVTVSFGTQNTFSNVTEVFDTSKTQTIINLKVSLEADPSFILFGMSCEIPSSYQEILIIQMPVFVKIYGALSGDYTYFCEATYCIYQLWGLLSTSIDSGFEIDTLTYQWERIGNVNFTSSNFSAIDVNKNYQRIYVQIIHTDGFVLPICGKYSDNTNYEALLAQANTQMRVLMTNTIYGYDDSNIGNDIGIVTVDDDDISNVELNDFGIDCYGIDNFILSLNVPSLSSCDVTFYFLVAGVWIENSNYPTTNYTESKLITVTTSNCERIYARVFNVIGSVYRHYILDNFV